MSAFQSYLTVAPTPLARRAETKKIARSLGINIEKVSPDIFFIGPTKQEISIDQIRQLKSHIFQKPLEYSHKFIVIVDAHKATLEAQNSLLKILEEPPVHAILVLETKNKSLLLPTITSRAVTIRKEHPPNYQDAKALIAQDLNSALELISEVDSPEEFLDEQIIALGNLLVNEAKAQNKQSFSSSKPAKIVKAIEDCAQTKEMIVANVNPTFALTNLVFSLNLASK